MRWLLSILGSACLIILLFSPCKSQTTIDGSGKIAKETRQVSKFRKVSLFGSGKLVITQNKSESLILECDENILEHIQSKVKEEELEIGPKDVILNPSRPILYRLSLKQVDILKIFDSAVVEISDLKTKIFKAVVNNPESFHILKLDAESATFEITGPGTVRVDTGVTRTQVIFIRGPAKYNAPRFESDNAEIDITGAGQAKVWVKLKLDAKISRSGKVEYYGSPTISSDIPVSGKLKSLGEKP